MGGSEKMTIEIFLDATNGSDTLGNGSSLAPYRTLQYFCDSVAVKNNADYKVFLNNGVYEITNGTIFGQFNSGNMTIIGKGENTEIVQRAYMYQNSVGGNADFSLIIAKCKYNILTTLTGANVNGFRWKWSFYNVLFEYTPNNQTSVFSTSGKELVFRNCVKLTNTTSFLRKNSSVISVYDSIGYFTNGYQTTQADWDKGGNTIGSIQNYSDLLNYQGEYAWITSKSLILHDGKYKRVVDQEIKINYVTEDIIEDVAEDIDMTSPNTPAPYVASTNAPLSSGREAWRTFVKGSTSAWQGNPTALPQWVLLDTGGSIKLKKIRMDYTGSTGASGMPSALSIEGSNNGTSFTTIKKENSIPAWNSGDSRNFIVSSTIGYRYFRFYITAIHGNPSQCTLGRITLYTEQKTGEKIVEVKELIDIVPRFETISSTLPSSTQFLEQGMDSLSPLLDRKVTTLEPMEMTNKSEILGVGKTGKVFSKTIDLKKYFDIRDIRTEAKL